MEYFLISFKNVFVYRSKVIFSVIETLVYIFVQQALWSFVYSNTVKQREYMCAYVILVALIKNLYSLEIFEILSEKVLRGDFVYDLLRPQNVIILSYQKSLGQILAMIFLKCVPLLIVFGTFLNRMVNCENIFGAFIIIALGHILFNLMFAIVGLLSYIFIESWTLKRFLNDTITLFSGVMIPLSLFPRPLKIISDLLPFRFLYDYPVRHLLTNEISQNDVFYIILSCLTWILLMSIILCVAYKLITRHIMIQGG